MAAPLLGAAAGAGHAPLDMWYIAFPAFVLVMAAFAHASGPWRAAVIGWLFGLCHFGLAMRWIVEPFQVEADVYGWMAPFALIGMAAGLALFWGGAFYTAKRLGGLWTLVPVWALAELARGYLLTGLPWAMPAYIWAESLAIHYVAFTGSYGLNAVMFLLGAAILTGWRRTGFGAQLMLIGAPALYVAGALVIAPPPTLPDVDGPRIRLVQPNAPQDEKWRPENIPVFFNRQVEMTAEQPPVDLVVWPETALPMLLEDAGEAFSIIANAAQGAPVVVGIQRRQDDRYFNSLAVLGADGEITQVYDKHHLVPFGEYMPAAWLFSRFDIFGLAARAEAGYSRGTGPELLDMGTTGKAVPLICYEAVFPQYGFGMPERADFMIQITNDAWFGDDAGPYQHLSQARIRAIEQGVPMVRAANTGISAIIDARGRIVAQLGLGAQGHVDAALPEALPPTFYAQTGDWVIAVLVLVTILIAAFLRRRKKALQKPAMSP